MKLVMLRGIPASGKTTYARKLQEDGFLRVNKDNLREMLVGEDYDPAIESIVHLACQSIVLDCLKNKFNVVVDNTNLRSRDERKYKELADAYDAEFEVVDFDPPVEVCLKRDVLREKEVGRHVIEDFAQRFNRGKS